MKDVVVGMEYEFRVSAINLSGVGEYSNASDFVFARDPKSEQHFFKCLEINNRLHNLYIHEHILNAYEINYICLIM